MLPGVNERTTALMNATLMQFLSPQFAIVAGKLFTMGTRDDQEMLKHGLVVYDALYAWCRHTHSETHTWNPAAMGAYGAKVAKAS